MSVKMYVLSIAAIAVIGCGGSNGGSCCQSGIAPGEKAVGQGLAVAGSTGKLKLIIKNVVVKNKDTNSSRVPTSSITVNSVKSSKGNPICQTEDDGCKFSAVQTASKCDSDTKPEFNLSDCDEKKAETFFKGNITKFDSSKEVVVYGGTLEVTEASGAVDTCGLDVEINLPQKWCGKELKSGEPVGFANVDYRNGETMWVLITVTTKDGCSTKKVWKKAKVVDGKILLENLQDVQLPAKFVLFSVMEKPNRFSGATGIFGY